jgi:hypothetical protein
LSCYVGKIPPKASSIVRSQKPTLSCYDNASFAIAARRVMSFGRVTASTIPKVPLSNDTDVIASCNCLYGKSAAAPVPVHTNEWSSCRDDEGLRVEAGLTGDINANHDPLWR